jgi:hypothetical protein
MRSRVWRFCFPWQKESSNILKVMQWSTSISLSNGNRPSKIFLTHYTECHYGRYIGILLMGKLINYLLHDVYKYCSWNKCLTWYIIIQWVLETCSHTKCVYNIVRISCIICKGSGTIKQHTNSNVTLSRNLVQFIYNTVKLSPVFDDKLKHDI